MLADGRYARSGGALLGILAWCCVIAGTPEARADRQHTVKSGKSLTQIAKLYRIGADDLAAANGLDRGEPLRGGQVLKVPPEGVVYVSKGQTLGAIARAHGVSQAALAKTNNLEQSDSLRIGQRLMLPGAKASKTEQRPGKP